MISGYDKTCCKDPLELSVPWDHISVIFNKLAYHKPFTNHFRCACACVHVRMLMYVSRVSVKEVLQSLFNLGPLWSLFKMETPMESDRSHFTSLQMSRNHLNVETVWRRWSNLQLPSSKTPGELCTWVQTSHVPGQKVRLPLVARAHTHSEVLSSIFFLVKVSSTPSKKWKPCLRSPSNTKSLCLPQTQQRAMASSKPACTARQGSSTSFNKLFSVCSPVSAGRPGNPQSTFPFY